MLLYAVLSFNGRISLKIHIISYRSLRCVTKYWNIKTCSCASFKSSEKSWPKPDHFIAKILCWNKFILQRKLSQVQQVFEDALRVFLRISNRAQNRAKVFGYISLSEKIKLWIQFSSSNLLFDFFVWVYNIPHAFVRGNLINIHYLRASAVSFSERWSKNNMLYQLRISLKSHLVHLVLISVVNNCPEKS